MEEVTLLLPEEPSDGDAVKTAAIEAALRRRFDSKEWVLFTEVRNGDETRVRHADAVAFNLWPARGLEVHGVEVKASRGDWLAELKQPEKSSYFVGRCDRWWVAAHDAKVVLPGELPKGWGLLVLHGQTLRQVVPAELRADVLPPDRAFMASLLRHVGDQMKESASTQALREEYRRGVREGEKRERESKRWDGSEQKFRQLREAVERFERASGVRIGDSWRAPDVGKAVAHVLARNVAVREAEDTLTRTEQRLRDTLTRIAAERERLQEESA